MFEDIFSKKTERIISPEKIAVEIIADYREKNSLVPANLIRLGFDVKFKELKVADFIVKETVIERKTTSDFISSMINGRLSKQIEELKQYPSKILVIEGLEEKELYSDDSKKGVNANAVRSFLLSILLKHNIPIIYSKNSEDTARFISVLYKKEQKKEIPLNASKKSFSKKEQMQYILEGFPGIGPKTAIKLLSEFKTLRNLFNSTDEKIKEKLGKKSEVFRILDEKY